MDIVRNVGVRQMQNEIEDSMYQMQMCFLKKTRSKSLPNIMLNCIETKNVKSTLCVNQRTIDDNEIDGNEEECAISGRLEIRMVPKQKTSDEGLYFDAITTTTMRTLIPVVATATATTTIEPIVAPVMNEHKTQVVSKIPILNQNSVRLSKCASWSGNGINNSNIVYAGDAFKSGSLGHGSGNEGILVNANSGISDDSICDRNDKYIMKSSQPKVEQGTSTTSTTSTSPDIKDLTPGLRRRRESDKYVTNPFQLNLRFQRPSNARQQPMVR